MGRSKGADASGSSVGCSIVSNTTRGTWRVVPCTRVPGQIPAPHDGADLHVGDVEEALAAEEVLAGIRDPALHTGFAGRMDRHGGVDDEAAVLGVLEEDAVEARRVAIRPGDRRGEIVHDESAHDAAKEGPGGLQARRARRRDPAAA